MKKLFLLFVTLIAMISLSIAQTPNMFNYQAVIRNSDGNVLSNTDVEIQIRILDSSNGEVFAETHTVTTNANGIANLKIGEGTLISGNLNDFDFSIHTYFLKITFDNVEGTSQILPVPYALVAKNVEGIASENITDWNTAFGWGDHELAGYLTSFTETDPIFNASIAHGITSSDTANWNTISNVVTTTTNGLMSFQDKIKLDGLENGGSSIPDTLLPIPIIYQGINIWVSPVDNGSGLAWSEVSNGNATADSYTNGKINLPTTTGYPAANVCYNLELGGYDDWYLPSIIELEAIYKQSYYFLSGNTSDGLIPHKDGINNADKFYWSSTEDDNSHAFYLSIITGDYVALQKTEFENMKVRCVRRN